MLNEGKDSGIVYILFLYYKLGYGLSVYVPPVAEIGANHVLLLTHVIHRPKLHAQVFSTNPTAMSSEG